jgi:hypothetical protein
VHGHATVLRARNDEEGRDHRWRAHHYNEVAHKDRKKTNGLFWHRPANVPDLGSMGKELVRCKPENRDSTTGVNMNFDQIIDRLLDEGIEIKLLKGDGRRWYDLDTGMKSGLWIAQGADGAHLYRGRYKSGEFSDYFGLLVQAKQCRCGNDYANPKWIELLVSEGLLTKVTKTTTTYE